MNYLKNIIMSNNNKVVKLITHNGAFHADDIFSAAALGMMLEREGESYEIIRSRDPEALKTGDYLFDVGGIYDENANRFDHHQIGGAGQGPQGIEYSSFGLVWKKFGEKLAGSKRAAEIIQKKLCAPVDAADNGIDLAIPKSEITPYYIQTFFHSMVPTWKEDDSKTDEIFLDCVSFARKIIDREILQAQSFLEGEKDVLEAYETSKDKRIIILDKNYPFEHIVLVNFSEPLYVVFPRKAGNGWGVKAVRKNPQNFENRKDLPSSWAGLTDQELQKVTGVPDAVFCHRALFMASALSKEGAIKLAQIAVES